MTLPKRNILVASIGVAAVTYLSCTNGASGNLMAPPPCEAGASSSYCHQDAPTPDGPRDASIDADWDAAASDAE
jgi:hypothetical protein